MTAGEDSIRMPVSVYVTAADPKIALNHIQKCSVNVSQLFHVVS